ncbi:MAG: hypothetical protein WAW86_00490 [Gammaproteobacteria bacterium]
MNTFALVNTTLISSIKNAPIIKLELKKAVQFEGLTMTKQQDITTEAQAVALNIATVKSANPRLANALDSILKQAYNSNKRVYTNQVTLVATNQTSSLSPETLQQITTALDQTIADNTPTSKADQNHTPRRSR